ncbi:xanthine dehydrogenase accessory protein XdhC [Litoreibacter roseus]|uniref:Xanthine dehydrogenase accessory protein XdhC n=1 Tax=Litoreibacter roseus TaxID=2601869 RepID=A0A6N6JBZ9_9RHOB|nr:xanthine dehydrogenase accessory protein XdhC [Litoreibacter roseus]GFE63380.1 xanthine dehydrogenase accessory protein XdhC [Litoreibacter roseus]
MSFDTKALADAVALHGRVARIVVADVKGSTPREAGASMLVWPGGQSGTIGGGALEHEAALQAFDAPSLRHIPLGPTLGQCCGGAVSLVTEVFDAPLEINGCYSRRIAGETAKPLVIQRAEAAARNGTGDGALVFAEGWLFEAAQPVATPLWIYGAGHVGRALVDVLAPLPDFQITWIDTGLDRYPDTVPGGVRVMPAENPAEAVALAPADAHHLVLTYSHALDLELCHRILNTRFASAGLIGSDTKWARFRSRLRDLGHETARIDQISCPIGQPGLGKHPQAIAVGVAAGLLSCSDMAGTSRLGGGAANSGADIAS